MIHIFLRYTCISPVNRPDFRCSEIVPLQRGYPCNRPLYHYRRGLTRGGLLYLQRGYPCNRPLYHYRRGLKRGGLLYLQRGYPCNRPLYHCRRGLTRGGLLYLFFSFLLYCSFKFKTRYSQTCPCGHLY